MLKYNKKISNQELMPVVLNPRIRKRLQQNAAAVQKTRPQVYNPYKIPTNIKEFLKLCRIRSGVKIVSFDAYDYQLELSRVIDLHQGVMILKDRQLGITELLGGRILFELLLNPAYAAAVISINQEKAFDVSGRVKEMPSGLGLEWSSASKKQLKPKGCGEALFLPSTDNAARGLPSVTLFCIDEAGYIDNFTELYGVGSAAQEMVPEKHRKTILNTTVPIEGELSEFWQMFDSDNGDVSALEQIKLARETGSNCGIPGMVWWTDKNGWAKVILSHKVQPKYRHANYLNDVKQRRKIPESIVQREHNLGIETALGSLFSSDAIKEYAIGEWLPPWPSSKYLVCIDPNFGGSDNFVTLVWDVTSLPYKLVAEYAESERSTDYSIGKTVELIKSYKTVLIGIESNSGGKVIAEKLMELCPSHNIQVTITTNASKRVNTDRIALALEQGEVIYPADWKGVNEMKRFSQAKREATGGEKDDRVMAWAAGWAWLSEISSTESGIVASTQETLTTVKPKPKVDSFGRVIR